MPLELLEYAVYSDVVPVTVAGSNDHATIAIPNTVPVNETWRVDRIAAFLGTQNQSFTGGQAGSEAPVMFVYDTATPGPTTIPIDLTQLSTYPTSIAPDPPPLGGIFMYYIDAADYAAPLTLLAGSQLALLVYLGFLNTGPWVFGARVQYSRFLGVAGKAQPIAGSQPGPAIPMGI